MNWSYFWNPFTNLTFRRKRWKYSNNKISSVCFLTPITLHIICDFYMKIFDTATQFLTYLKGRNFRGKKISRISRILAKFAKINSFFDPEKCRFAKINSREIFQTWWFAKINSREILQELMKYDHWSFWRLFYHLFT